MSFLDEISLNDAITLYYEKLNATQNGDLLTLIALKKKYPELFNKANESQIIDVIQYAKSFQTSSHYKELQRKIMRERLYLIKDE